jgi:hypothetical protein
MHAAQVGDRSSVRSRAVSLIAQCWDRQITAIRIDERTMRKHPSRSHLSHPTQSQGRAIGQLSEYYASAEDAFCP